VGRFVVVEHDIEGVSRGTDEDDLEYGVPSAVGEGPKQICS